MQIIDYDKRFDDNIIALVARAKRAIGKTKPSIDEDLFDIQSNYIDKGDKFFLGIDDEGNLIAVIGYNILDKDTAVLHRFYVKPELKRQGLGAMMLNHVEKDLIGRNVKNVILHLGEYEHYFESYSFYAKHGYTFYEDRRMIKKLI